MSSGSGVRAVGSASQHPHDASHEPILVRVASLPGVSVAARFDWHVPVASALPPSLTTVDALVARQVTAGRGASLTAARERLAARMCDGVPATLQEARLRAGLSQVALAKILGTSQPRIARLEAGREDNPGLRTLRSLADALRLDMNAVSKLF